MKSVKKQVKQDCAPAGGKLHFFSNSMDSYKSKVQIWKQIDMPVWMQIATMVCDDIRVQIKNEIS